MRKGWTRQGMDAQYPTKRDKDMHHAYLVHRCQCKFRNEHFDITEQQFFDLWRDYWHLRGRAGDDMTMTRRDSAEGWTISNMEIITRREHLRRQNNLGNIKCE
jgi:hypothetical protein